VPSSQTAPKLFTTYGGCLDHSGPRLRTWAGVTLKATRANPSTRRRRRNSYKSLWYLKVLQPVRRRFRLPLPGFCMQARAATREASRENTCGVESPRYPRSCGSHHHTLSTSISAAGSAGQNLQLT
jgi:hypothetical protein